MLSRPVHYNELLQRQGVLDELYKALQAGNTAELVTTARQCMLKSNTMPNLVKKVKSEETSTSYRNEGNKAFKRGLYQPALINYNKALMHAPPNSHVMKLAYSNRSALLLKLKCFGECLSDIDTCFDMGCPPEIAEKLNKRKKEATSMHWIESLAESANHTDFIEDFFDFDVKRNPQIPCASADIGVIVESNIPKIVALSDIKVGMVVAKECAFVSMNNYEDTEISCHFCHTKDLNLIPCDRCCSVMFCDENCKDLCLYHYTECQFVELIQDVCVGPFSNLIFYGALQLRSEFKSWTDFNDASNNMGTSRMKQSSINEIFDADNKFSMLCFQEEMHFVDARMYNTSFSIAALVHYMDKVGYFPSAPYDKKIAINAMARVMMYLALCVPVVNINATVNLKATDRSLSDNIAYGWYSFIGKLNHSCNPNVKPVGLGKEMALVAIQPIKKGTEIKYSLIGHWLDRKNVSKIKDLFMMRGKIICNCQLCNGGPRPTITYQLTEAQKQCYRKLNLASIESNISPRSIPKYYHKLSKCLSYLSNVPYSKEYEAVYFWFNKCISYIQDKNNSNVALA